VKDELVAEADVSGFLEATPSVLDMLLPFPHSVIVPLSL
jgi:hypothetical protein